MNHDGADVSRDLMRKEDLNNLGLGEDRTYTRVDPEAGKREAQGFVAGTGVRASSKWRIFGE